MTNLACLLLSEFRKTKQKWSNGQEKKQEIDQSSAAINRSESRNKHSNQENKSDDEQEFSEFKDLINEFLFQNQIFEISMPYITSIVPLTKAIQLNFRLRNFSKKNGQEHNTQDGYEFYELSNDHLGDLARRLETMSAFSKGMEILPELFLMGLVSSYDAFLSELLRTVLNVRPGIISLEDKALTLKDLMEVGSVSAARQRLVDRT